MCIMDKPKINNQFNGKRINNSNIYQYILSYFGQGNGLKLTKKKSLQVTPFLQNNYGKKGDCTITSILTLTYFYTLGTYKDTELYDYIEKAGKKYFYNGDTYGTIPTFNKAIVKNVFKHFGIDRKITTKYFKGIGFKLEDIQKILDMNQPIMISIYKDGRNYYEGHTITIFGYSQYEDNYGNKKIMLAVYDNWFTTVSYLDYDLLNINCMICY